MPAYVFVVGMSRSGTTLLATVLDAHPSVSMAYELLPGGLPAASRCADLVDAALEAVGNDDREVAKHLGGMDAGSLATFVRRAARTLVPPDRLVELFREYAKSVDHPLDSIRGRAHISRMIVERKRIAEATVTAGFKLNSPSIKEFDKAFEDARYIYILRDPRDVLASHIANDFDRSVEEVAKSWNNYLENFLKFRERNAERAALVRYEDLVARPEATIREAVSHIGLPFEASMIDFVDSKASAHASQHSNAPNLAKGFFLSSVNRWVGRLEAGQVRHIEEACGEHMESFGHERAGVGPLAQVDDKRRQKMARAFGAKRKFYRDEYGQLLDLLSERGTNLTWVEAARGVEVSTDSVLIVRHDIDHDLDTAVELARLENERGIRATYCALHTAWYYGELGPQGYHHTDFLIDSLLEIQRLGHEINLHNNFAVVGLKEGLDPIALLEREVMALRSYGIDIRGTSTHGDQLCRELGFRNYELFAESVYEERGGPRTVEYEEHRIRLGDISMEALDLEYEAYDLPRDEYVTDSGGRLRYKRNTRGRGGLRRTELAVEPTYGTIIGALTHPVWWDLSKLGGRALSDLAEKPDKWPDHLRGNEATSGSGA
jgi:hypothetical protein